jgi:hypothetical protein
MAGELGAPEGYKFFQLKVGGTDVRMGGGNDGMHAKRFCDAHIIGVVTNADGDCLCRAWETRERKLIEFQDNVYKMKYRNIGPLSLEVQGINS